MLARRLAAGTIVAAIVGVVAVDDHGEAALGGERAQAAVQLVLAVVAAVRGVGAILGPFELGGVNHFVREAEVARDRQRELAMRVRIAGAVGGDGERARAEGRGRGDRQVCAVDAAAERDQDGLVAGEDVLQAPALFGEDAIRRRLIVVVLVFVIVVVVVLFVFVVVLLFFLVVEIIFFVGDVELERRVTGDAQQRTAFRARQFIADVDVKFVNVDGESHSGQIADMLDAP